MSRHQVLLPCRRFDALVTYQPFDGLSPVEGHALLAVAAGSHSVEKLVRDLQLPQRLVLDACIDLLSIGAIEIGEGGTLIVGAVALDRMGDWRAPKPGWESRFATSAAPPPDEVQLMQDMVSGSVFRAVPRQFDFRGGLHDLPPDPDLSPLDALTRSDLLAAVLTRPIRPTGARPASTDGVEFSSRRARIAEVRLRRADVAADPAQPTLQMTVRSVQVDLSGVRFEDQEPPRFSVLGPTSLSSVVRQRISASLARLWDRGIGRGPGQVFDVLQFAEEASDDPAPVRAELPAVTVSRLQEAIDLCDGTATEADHERLLGLERDAVVAVTRATNAGTGAALVEGASAHHDALYEALRSAEQQVVLACPWVNRLENASVREAIVGAVDRGVRVFVLWGIGRDEPMPMALAALREELPRRSNGGGLFAPDRPSRSHAKVIACDHKWAIVTSSNFLNSGPERTTAEIGIRLSSPPPVVDSDPSDSRGAASNPISDILRWSRSAMSDYRVGRRVLDAPVLFGLADGSRRVHEPRPMQPPRALPIWQRVWRAEWQKEASELLDRLNAAGAYAFALDGAAHRDLLFDAIAGAERRILVESPKVGPAATSPPFVRAVLEARARNVEVAIRFAEREPAGAEGDTRWMSLASAGVRFLEADTHAKVLVCDEWMVATSFNFLSFEGRGRRELGIQVVDAAIADQTAGRFL